MKAYFCTAATIFGLVGCVTMALAETDTPSYELQIGFTESRHKGVTLGDDASLDQLDNDEITIEIDLEYSLNDRFYVFFGGDFFTEDETIKSANTNIDASGFELGGTGVGFIWGEDVEYQLEIG